ncbi:ArsC family reductase [Marinobacter sp. CHS3-4]|uniref:ArsC family reductase n=1 Tax=Marinobacter sp. CHS3-4 TaxID=3045174 RepID=UPI0024B570E5|nr:ArsC family reductase [Marinobacter sp. CHS3-4]MDI9245094.1 ArsC family reductase [Marinobacter sp. CHS3-4]
MKLFGIRNCDTVKKARKWLDEAGVDYQFHDFKKDGLDSATLEKWEKSVGWEVLVNRRGTTWRKLPEQVRDNIDAQTAHELMLENNSLIKRPVVEHDKGMLIGFDADQWAQQLNQ